MNNIICKPNGSVTYQSSLHKLRAIEMPLWHCILANYFKSDILLDAEIENLTTEETVNQILSSNPKEIKIISTGSHPSANIQQLYEANKIKELLKEKGIESEVYQNIPVSLCKWAPPDLRLLGKNISSYRTHNWHSWSNNCITQPYGSIFTSTSCPMDCQFCNVKNFYGNRYEARTLEDVAYDFATLANLGIKNIKIMDELFIFNPNRVHSICDNIISNKYDFNIWAYARIDIMNKQLLEKMKLAGINWLAYGIESGNEEIRKKAKGSFSNDKIREVIKITKDAGISCLGNYIFGFVEDNLETMEETFNLAKELNCEYSNFYCLVDYSKINENTDYTQYAQMSSNFKPLGTKFLKPKEVLKFRDEAFLQYYTSPRYLNMMLLKYGQKVCEEINTMTNTKIERIYASSN